MKYALLTIATLLLMFYSWHVSIKHKRYHGIPRFFAFEGIVVLLFVNYPFWFKNPTSSHQLVSWILLASSIFFALWSVISLYRDGKPRDRMEDTTFLVDKGLFRLVRHPMYFSLLLFACGAFLKQVSSLTWGLVALVLLGVLITAKYEEQEMALRFGESYKAYLKQNHLGWVLALWFTCILTFVVGFWL